MPLILAIAAIAYYNNKKNCENDSTNTKRVRKIDPRIQLKGKKLISLHSIEQNVTINELPITTITYVQHSSSQNCSTDHIVSSIKQRFNTIVQCNPWIGGWLLPMPDGIKIIHDPNGTDRPPNMFSAHYKEEKLIVEGQMNEQNTVETGLVTKDMMVVADNNDLIGQNQPIFKVSIIISNERNLVDKMQHFAIVISMSHLVGDAYTYYQIVNMILNQESDIKSFNPVRHTKYAESIQQVFGDTTSYIVQQNQQEVQKSTKPIVSSTERIISDKASDVSIVDKVKLQKQEVSKKLLNKLSSIRENIKEKRSINKTNREMSFTSSISSSSSSLNNPTNQSQVAPLDELDISIDSQVSTDTTISGSSSESFTNNIQQDTSDAVLNKNNNSSSVEIDQTDQQLQALTIPGIDINPISMKRSVVIKKFQISSKWINEQRDLHSSSSTTVPTINSIISSWFFRINDASTNMVMINLRNCDSFTTCNQYGCTITNNDVGNYSHVLVGNTNFHHPDNIHQAIQDIGSTSPLTAKSTIINNISTPHVDDSMESDTTVTTKSDNNIHSVPARTSICTNWTSFYAPPSNITVNNTSQPVSSESSDNSTMPITKSHHYPIYDTNILQQLPEQVSVIHLFTVHHNNDNEQIHIDTNDTNTTGNSTNETKNHHPTESTISHGISETSSYRKKNKVIGAYVVCLESVWHEQIVPSGIICSQIIM